MVDILIAGGTVVTMDKERRIIKNGSLAIEGNSIVGVGKTEELKRNYSADRIVEADGRLVLPGFVSSHRHLQGSSQCRGVNMDRRAGDRKPGGLYTWLMPMKELIPDEDRYYLSMVNVLADLRMGVTCNGVQDLRAGELNN